MYATFETGEVKRFDLAIKNGGTVFDRIPQIQAQVEQIERDQTKKVKLIEVSFEVAGISNGAAKYLKNHLGVELKKVNGESTQVTMCCKPENIGTTLLAVMAAVEVGETYDKIHKLKQIDIRTNNSAKAMAQHNIKAGAVNRDCPLIHWIVKQNGMPVTGDSIDQVRMVIEKMPDKRELLAMAYNEVFGEPYPDPKKDASIKDMFTMNDIDFDAFSKEIRRGPRK